MERVERSFGHLRGEPAHNNEKTVLHEEAAKCDRSTTHTLETKSAAQTVPHVWSKETYVNDQLPKSLGPRGKARLRIYYKFLPERYYKQTGVPVVTPDSFDAYLRHDRGCNLVWDFHEVFSGSSVLSFSANKLGMEVGFPVDYRYGWDVANKAHQMLLDQAGGVQATDYPVQSRLSQLVWCIEAARTEGD